MMSAFLNLKSNAKRRGHDCALTYDEFRQFAIQTDYIVRKGKTIDSFSIDRIDNSKGYEMGNIQILTLSENSQKRTKKCVYDWETKTFWTRTNENNANFEDVPF